MACKVGALLEPGSTLNTDDQATLVRALSELDCSADALAQALTEHGYPVGSTTVKNHRAGGARDRACSRTA